uniref:Protein quiver n=1 Tax=Timema bartmani TaxID=61472 RepID=A0A7R9FB60_9NEOP|nr:unnamed protein product [Timema bartmani]
MLPLVCTNILVKCRKYAPLRLSFDFKEKKATLRTCSFARTDHVDPCEDLKSKGNNVLHVSFCGLCETDGCNSVGRLVIPWLLMILLALLVIA